MERVEVWMVCGVEIVSMPSRHSPASIDVLFYSRNPSPTLCRCIEYLSNWYSFCSTSQWRLVDVRRALFQRTSRRNRQRRGWIGSVAIRATTGQGRVCFENTHVCLAVFPRPHKAQRLRQIRPMTCPSSRRMEEGRPSDQQDASGGSRCAGANC